MGKPIGVQVKIQLRSGTVETVTVEGWYSERGLAVTRQAYADGYNVTCIANGYRCNLVSIRYRATAHRMLKELLDITEIDWIQFLPGDMVEAGVKHRLKRLLQHYKERAQKRLGQV